MPLIDIIAYRDFYDVPRAFLVRHNGRLLFFDCPFSDDQDDYPGTYRVYRMPDSVLDELDGSWERLTDRSEELICEIPVAAVQFDSSRREQMETGVLDVIASQADRRSGSSKSAAKGRVSTR